MATELISKHTQNGNKERKLRKEKLFQGYTEKPVLKLS